MLKQYSKTIVNEIKRYEKQIIEVNKIIFLNLKTLNLLFIKLYYPFLFLTIALRALFNIFNKNS
jgi:hypothetical protein